jgi:hypothetical protein
MEAGIVGFEGVRAWGWAVVVRGHGTEDRGQRTGSEYMYMLERNLGNIGTLGRKSLWARKKKILWSD